MTFLEAFFDPSSPLFWIGLVTLLFLVEAIPFSPIHVEALLLGALIIVPARELYFIALTCLYSGALVSYLWTWHFANHPRLKKRLESEKVVYMKTLFLKYGDPFFLLLRVVPVIPYRTLNMISAPLEYPFKKYATWTFIGTAARLALIIYGTEAFSLLIGDRLTAILIFLVVLVISSGLVVFYLNRKSEGLDSPDMAPESST